MTSRKKFTGKKSKSPIAPRAFKKQNGGSETPLTIRQKDQDIHESNGKLRQAEHAIVEMTERQLELNIQREREINELTIVIAGLEQEISKQKANIAVLESQLQRRFTAPDHRVLTAIDILQIGNSIARRSHGLSRLPRFSFLWLFLMDFCQFVVFKRFLSSDNRI
jgi:hypothetical protein